MNTILIFATGMCCHIFLQVILSSLVPVNIPKMSLPHSLWRGFEALVSTEKTGLSTKWCQWRWAWSITDISRGEIRALADISAERAGLRRKTVLKFEGKDRNWTIVRTLKIREIQLYTGRNKFYNVCVVRVCVCSRKECKSQRNQYLANC